MISLRRAGEIDELRSTLLHAASLILEGIAVHSVELVGNDRGAFQELMRRHSRELMEAGAKPAATMVVVGAAIQSIQAFNRRTEQEMQAQVREIRAIVALLASALARACAGNQRAVAGIRSMERGMERASQLEDIQDVKRELAGCLAGVGKELERQASEAAANDSIARHALRDPIVQLATQEASGPGAELFADPVTGLPGVRQAQSAIAGSLGAGHHAVVAATVDRIEAINTRFGREAGDRVMLFISQHFASKLQPDDQIFRWHGPCFLALVDRGDSVEALRAEMNRLLAPRIDHMIEIGERSILVPLSLSWIVIPLWQQDSADEVCRQIDKLQKRS
ncbi:MAG TPA: GGDEF domain-containing protein [Bryobacteraceae bacterium]|nr:GGDEF domain-containing protein [Bryobacteraceae bacterium]